MVLLNGKRNICLNEQYCRLMKVHVTNSIFVFKLILHSKAIKIIDLKGLLAECVNAIKQHGTDNIYHSET